MSKQVFSLLGVLLLLGIGLQAQSDRKFVVFPAVQTVKLKTGVNLQFVEQGDPQGVPVVLLHGFTDSWHSYELVLPCLPAAVHAFAITQRGHGDSDKPLNGYDPKDFAADVAAFLEARQLTSAVIVGHSMGSVIAQRFAIDYPERSLGIVLVGAFASFGSNEAVQNFSRVLDTLNDPVGEEFVASFQQSTLANPVPATYLQTVIRESLKVPARVWKSAGAGLFKADYVPELRGYAKPALIVWGDKDVFCPKKDQELLNDALKGSQTAGVQGYGPCGALGSASQVGQ